MTFFVLLSKKWQKHKQFCGWTLQRKYCISLLGKHINDSHLLMERITLISSRHSNREVEEHIQIYVCNLSGGQECWLSGVPDWMSGSLRLPLSIHQDLHSSQKWSLIRPKKCLDCTIWGTCWPRQIQFDLGFVRLMSHVLILEWNAHPCGFNRILLHTPS